MALTNLDITQSNWPSAPQNVKQAIYKAAEQTGVNFSYLMSKASQESSFRADVQAKTSSATGLYQFIDSTWLESVKQHGAKYGLENLASEIQTGSNGKAQVLSAEIKQEILELRKDPYLAAVMAAEFTKSNQQAIESNLNRDVTDTDLYLAHFLGAGGATKFLSGLEENPNQPAAHILPSAARANKNVFYHPNGQAKSVAEIYTNFEQKFETNQVAQITKAAIKNKVQPFSEAAHFLFERVSSESYSMAGQQKDLFGSDDAVSPIQNDQIEQLNSKLKIENSIFAHLMTGLAKL